MRRRQSLNDSKTNVDPLIDVRKESMKKTTSVPGRASMFKKAVFRVVEGNESARQDPLNSSKSKGYAEIESLDGTFRFKVGIIDFLTEYDNKKYLENVFKSTIHHVD